MKLNRLETHDRLLSFKKEQSDIVSQGVQECLKENPLSLELQRRSKYIYIFAHPRTADNGITKILMWQPRLSKPPPQTNSYLFRAISNTDTLEVCWLLPPEEMWKQYQKGNVTESDLVLWSIDQYRFHRDEMKKPYSDDLSKPQIDRIYYDIAKEIEEDVKLRKLKFIKLD